ncbi:SDR family NAD(P)-dependent oxidoreductase [Ancylobacter mangrovi]|uniref:SDR family NAD(P)-dependent oxidoreductase n=1 Tax=Ancylobacter mangrovi TaxID=2972472 RepID=UPI0021635584|nr:SDR family NAD(P)-dependent oxidoreductase [Ancylobacter mangrovi]MCS0501874.1 SDR family NAD(P)-dependent oxidoreductase [Ancylobacter mangrovi]
MNSQSLGTAVVTGASSGIGRSYATQLARKGYDLVLVARNRGRLEALSGELATASPGRSFEVLVADLESAADVTALADRIAGDPAITLLVNNAGAGTEGPVIGADVGKIDAMVQLNVVALSRLAVAAANAFAARGRGTLVNIASVVALMPENLLGAYSATKAYVLALTQSLHNELKDGPVRIQAVLPGLTRTEFFDRSGLDIASYPPEMMMEVDELVAAALAGLEMGEVITIPSLPDAGAWDALVAARMAMLPDLSRDHAAARYGLKAEAAE